MWGITPPVSRVSVLGISDRRRSRQQMSSISISNTSVAIINNRVTKDESTQTILPLDRRVFSIQNYCEAIYLMEGVPRKLKKNVGLFIKINLAQRFLKIHDFHLGPTQTWQKRWWGFQCRLETDLSSLNPSVSVVTAVRNRHLSNPLSAFRSCCLTVDLSWLYTY